MVVPSIHFGSMLVGSLKIISTFQDGWLYDTAINIHHGENFRNQEPQKSTKSFSEEIQMCSSFKEAKFMKKTPEQ